MRNNLPVAYSHLPELLATRRIKISELQKRLRAAGVKVNHKSLYRLTSTAPIHKIDTRIVGAICQTFSVGIQDLIGFEAPGPRLEKLTVAAQDRLDDPMTRQTEGKLGRSELAELVVLSEKAHELTLANARLLVAQRKALSNSGTHIEAGKTSKLKSEVRKRVPKR